MTSSESPWEGFPTIIDMHMSLYLALGRLVTCYYYLFILLARDRL